MWHDNFGGYENKGRTYIEYGRTPKVVDLQRAMQPCNIKTLKHGPSFNTGMVNKYYT
jgi:hypothetical protein